jgi:hypothetical protein
MSITSKAAPVADHPARRARLRIRHRAIAETSYTVRYARKAVMYAAKRLSQAGDREGNQLALTAAVAIDDLITHLGGRR